MSENKVDPVLYSTKDAAKYLGFSEQAVRISRYTNVLAGADAPKFVRIGTRTIKYKKSALDSWINEHAIEN